LNKELEEKKEHIGIRRSEKERRRKRKLEGWKLE
jgi:hypothetical protein